MAYCLIVILKFNISTSTVTVNNNSTFLWHVYETFWCELGWRIKVFLWNVSSGTELSVSHSCIDFKCVCVYSKYDVSSARVPLHDVSIRSVKHSSCLTHLEKSRLVKSGGNAHTYAQFYLNSPLTSTFEPRISWGVSTDERKSIMSYNWEKKSIKETCFLPLQVKLPAAINFPGKTLMTRINLNTHIYISTGLYI